MCCLSSGNLKEREELLVSSIMIVRHEGIADYLAYLGSVMQAKSNTNEVILPQNAVESRSGNSPRTFLGMPTQDSFDLGL